jgi:hypothetical protein
MLIERLDRLATARNVITTLLLALSLLLSANAFSSHFYIATGGYGLLDLGGGRDALAFQKPYTPADAYALVVHWGAGGRQDQLLFTLTLDVLLPPATWLFLTLALLYVTRPFARARWRSPWRCCFLPGTCYPTMARTWQYWLWSPAFRVGSMLSRLSAVCCG